MRVDIEVTALRVGHRLPTGFIDRQLILVVRAFDEKGRTVGLLQGETLPASTGKWSALPGALFAKQLVGEAARTPVPFWLPVERTNDTRLSPELPERRAFVFEHGIRHVVVQLWYRRFWQEVAAARGWTDNDSLIHEIAISCGGGNQTR
jgi:hypothetical protein